jgi:hypothetical protein
VAQIDLKGYARRGAQVRAAELREELAGIYRAFPELRKGNVDGGFTRRLAGGGVGIEPPRRRKPMTAAQKAEIGRRMKKYWAARRKAKG